jgi:hypothetical protein
MIATKGAIKVGDKVKILEVIDNFPKDKVGSIAKVMEVCSNGGNDYGLKFDFKLAGVLHSLSGQCSSDGYYFPLSCIKKVEIAKRSHKKKAADRSVTPFVVGDEVEFIENYKPDGGKKIGDKVTLTRIGENDGGQLLYYKGTKDEVGVYATRVKLAKGAKSPPIPPELVEDPRTFYKVVRIDGAPANGSARSTGFKYTLPVDGPTEWTPTINDISLCNRGYHVIEAKDIERWVTREYNGTDTLVCECKARGEIKQGDNKYVAQSIQLTKILYRWKDAEVNYNKGIREIEKIANDKTLEVNTRGQKAKEVINQECHDAKQAYADKFFAIGR